MNQKTDQHLLEYNGIIKENDELYRGLARTMGLPDGAFWILYTLRERDEAVTQREICDAIYLSKQTVNSALKKLEQEGYLVLNGQKDRRSKQIRLTEKGVTLAANTVDRVFAFENRTWAGLTEEEQEIFLRLFHKYTALLKKNMREAIGESQCSGKETE